MRALMLLMLASCDSTLTVGYCDQSHPCIYRNQPCSGDNCGFCGASQCGEIVCDESRHACVVTWLDLGMP